MVLALKLDTKINGTEQEIPEVNPHIRGWLIFNKDTRIFVEKGQSSQ